MAEPLVGRQERALPFALGRPIMQPSAWHRQLQGAKGGDQLAWPAAVAVSVGGLTALENVHAIDRALNVEKLTTRGAAASKERET